MAQQVMEAAMEVVMEVATVAMEVAMEDTEEVMVVMEVMGAMEWGWGWEECMAWGGME